jgi:hypothetical protein
MGRRLSAAVLTAAVFAISSLILSVAAGLPAWAQKKLCPGHPACVDATYHPSDGYCYSSPQFFTGALSHWQATCASGETLDRATGICHPTTCGGGGCREQPVCPQGETYTGPANGQGVCESRSGLGYISHEIVPCPTGWTLDASRGVCRYCPPPKGGPVGGGQQPPVRLPDLTIERTWLALPGSSTHVQAVHNGHPYLACFIVANIGAAPSGPFRVAGGGLGIPTNPYQDHASLAAGASRQGCLNYPTTPAPGSYNLGIMADSLHAVHESREDNNEAVIHVVVVP